MTRLHTESLCSYSGRSDSKAESIWIENNQMGNWSINPWYINSPSFDVSEIDGNQLNTLCGFMGNCKIEESEVGETEENGENEEAENHWKDEDGRDVQANAENDKAARDRYGRLEKD